MIIELVLRRGRRRDESEVRYDSFFSPRKSFETIPRQASSHLVLFCWIDFFFPSFFLSFLLYFVTLQVIGKKKLKEKICCRTRKATRNRRITLTTRHVFFQIIMILYFPLQCNKTPRQNKIRLFLGITRYARDGIAPRTARQSALVYTWQNSPKIHPRPKDTSTNTTAQ